MEERGLGLVHAPCRVGIGERSCDAGQRGKFQSVSRVLSRLFECQQDFARGSVALVGPADAALVVDLGLGLGAGPVEVEIRVEVMGAGVLAGLGGGGLDVAEANVLADDSCVFGFDQAVVSGTAGTAFGLFDAPLTVTFRSGPLWSPPSSPVDPKLSQRVTRRFVRKGCTGRRSQGFWRCCSSHPS